MYSSGTTAHPKGVPITYGNFYWKTIGHLAEFGLSAADRTLMAGPMYHVGAFDLPGIGTWWVGGSLVILPRFDVPDLLAAIERERPTNVWLAPAMVNATLNEIAKTPELGRRTPHIRFITRGREEHAGDARPSNGCWRPSPTAWLFADAYGLTETGVRRHVQRPGAHAVEDRLGRQARGQPGRGAFSARHDAPAAPGTQGEIALRGPKVVSGYWKNPTRRRPRSRPTAGSAPGTSAASMRTATSISRTARRT